MKRLVIFLVCIVMCFSCATRARQPNTVTVWHWMTDRHEALQELARRYQEETGVRVVVELYAPSDAYSRKIIAAAQARVLPDIYGILDTKKTFALFIESGFVADLTPYFMADGAAWQKSMFDSALNANRFEEGNIYNIPPGIYGVPIDAMNIQMLYNKNLLKQAGISRPPETFHEFLRQVALLKRIGIAGFVSGWGEAWLIQCFATNYAFNIMGTEKVMATYRGEVPYTDPDWVKVFTLFQTLADEDALIDGIVTKGNKYAEQDFALERAAFAFNGSWGVNVYAKMNPNLDYGVMPPPKINPDLPMAIWGAAGSSFVVNNASEHKTLAIRFLRWLSDTGQQVFLVEQTKNIPANRHALSAIPPELAGFAGAMDMATHPSVWTHNEDPLVVEAFDKGIQSIIIGDTTPQAVAREVQAMKERHLQQRRNR